MNRSGMVSSSGEFARRVIGLGTSVVDGGKQDLALTVKNPARAGQIYVMLGSVTGTYPGSSIGNGLTLSIKTASLAGLRFVHACFVYDFRNRRMTHASNAVAVELDL